eukprot:5734902-Alexandrium_andersonii.AAC.1
MKRWSLMGSSCTFASILKYLSRNSAQSMQRLPFHLVGSVGAATWKPRVRAATTVSHSNGCEFQSPTMMMRASEPKALTVYVTHCECNFRSSSAARAVT